MEYRNIKYEPGKVARVILNRPRYCNAQSRVLLEEVDDAFSQAIADDEVRVIVVSGEGDHFSAGHDLGTPEELADREKRPPPTDGQGRYERSRWFSFERTLAWRNLKKPTIAMVQGYCIWAGWMMAAAMDIIFASEDALFLTAHNPLFSMPWEIGPRKAKEVLFENRFITAREAYEHHFVNRVYPRDRLEEETLAYANRVAENDPFALRLMKSSINHMRDTMGYTNEVEADFNTRMVIDAMGVRQRGLREGQRIGRADVALRNLKLSLGYQEE